MSRVIRQETYIGLQRAEQVTEKRMLDTERENFSLDHRALNVIILKNWIFAESFHRIEILSIS